MKRLSFAEAKEILKSKGFEVSELKKQGYKYKLEVPKASCLPAIYYETGTEVVRFCKEVDDVLAEKELNKAIQQYYSTDDTDEKGEKFFSLVKIYNDKKGLLSSYNQSRLEFLIMIG